MNRVAFAAAGIFLAGLLGACSDKPATPTPPPVPVAASSPGVVELPSHSDENWVNGVAKGWGAAFFVLNRPGIQELLAVGTRVTFSDGTQRLIQSTKVNGDTLIVNLDGVPLDGKVVGYPNSVRVSKSTR